MLLTVGTAVVRQRDMVIIGSQARDLEAYSQTLESEVDLRTRNILATAEIGRAIAEIRDLENLFKQVVRLITERFDFYHAQVFLVDEANRYALLRASSGMAGQQLMSRRHQLEVGSQSIVGKVTGTGEAVVVSDTDLDPVHRRNELLPHTRSELAMPLRVGTRIIGALDIQSVEPNAFTQADVTVFQTLADQLAVAIERVRLFERTQRDLSDIENLNRQLIGDAWQRYTAGGASAPGFRVDTKGVYPITEDDVQTNDNTVTMPLKVRGQTIGMLDVTPRTGDEPDEETQNMLQAVADRVAQALDSTRLGEQSRRQADQEQILNQLVTQLQGTTDLDIILRLVAEQTSRALDTSRGFVHLNIEEIQVEGEDA